MKTYGLIGKSLSHSFSANFFSTMFENKAIEAKYVNFELASIQEILTVFAQAPSGLNVTIPYKESVLAYLDELDPLARTIGAVNTIVFDGNHKIGHNTDVFGFQQSIKPFLTNQHERAIIFGTGGAATVSKESGHGVSTAWFKRFTKDIAVGVVGMHYLFSAFQP